MNKQNSPLRITSPASCPAIGLSICPGKVDALAFSGPCQRNLAEDVTSVKDWGAKRVITLLEQHELEYLQVARLGLEVENAGMLWHHWEVIDGSALRARKAAKIDLWHDECEMFLEDLQLGNKIFIHCRGGLGRTGTLAARLLISMGMRPAEAIKQVRAARPGAIETQEQEDYLLHKAWQDMLHQQVKAR